MCQFNLIFVKNSKNKKILKNNEYNYFGDDFDNFSPYVKGYCNCNSFVGSMSEYAGDTYLEMIENSNKFELEQLSKIKDFMNKPAYQDLREKYIENKETLSNAVEKFLEPLSTYEIEQINILEKKYNGKELQKHTELLYKELDEKLKKIENSSEFKSAETKLNKFIEKNKLMEESTLYYLTKEDENKDKKLEEISDDDLFEQNDYFEDLGDFSEIIKISEEDSLVIDNVIKKLENKYEDDYNVFLEYKQLFENLLENEDYILFCCIWDEPGKMSIEKEVNIKNIKIEDLASLQFNKMIKICK